MSTLIVEVCSVNNVIAHPNADLLDLVTIKGWTCVTQKGKYGIGDLVVYVPIDAVLPQSLSDSLGITNYLRNGRVCTIKLRGYYSQGVIVPLSSLPKGKYNEGDDVKEILNITKYSPPVRPIKTNQKFRRKCSDPRFHVYTNIENIKNYPNVLTSVTDVVITEKIHGCFSYETLIKLQNNKVKCIGDLVENNVLGETVIGYDFNTDQLVPTKIISMFRYSKRKDWVKVTVFTGVKLITIICTSNHQFYTENGWKSAINLCTDDIVYGYTNKIGESLSLLPRWSVVSVILFSPKSTVSYDIETETHNYFANNVLVHNSNARYSKLDGNIVSGTHHCQLSPDDVSWFTEAGNRYNLNACIEEGDILYGELYGKGIQKLTYGLDLPQLIFFDYYSSKLHKYLDFFEFQELCTKNNLPCVPVLYTGPWSTDLMPLANGSSQIAAQIKEGFVVKPLNEQWHPKLGRVILKHISEAYLVHKKAN